MDGGLGLRADAPLPGDDDNSAAPPLGGVLGALLECPELLPNSEAKGFNLDEAIGGMLARLALLPDLDRLPVFDAGGGGGRGGNGSRPLVAPVSNDGKCTFVLVDALRGWRLAKAVLIPGMEVSHERSRAASALRSVHLLVFGSLRACNSALSPVKHDSKVILPL